MDVQPINKCISEAVHNIPSMFIGKHCLAFSSTSTIRAWWGNRDLPSRCFQHQRWCNQILSTMPRHTVSLAEVEGVISSVTRRLLLVRAPPTQSPKGAHSLTHIFRVTPHTHHTFYQYTVHCRLGLYLA